LSDKICQPTEDESCCDGQQHVNDFSACFSATSLHQFGYFFVGGRFVSSQSDDYDGVRSYDENEGKSIERD